MQRKFEFSYDEENDDLFLFRADSKSKGSVEWGGNIIIDFNTNKELVGIQVLNASETLTDFIPDKADLIKSMLKHLKGCKVDIRERAGLMVIGMFLVGNTAEVPTTITIPSLAHPMIARNR